MKKLLVTCLGALISMSLFSQGSKTFRLAIQGGLSYMIAKTHSSLGNELRLYSENLKSGFYMGTDFSWFFKEQYGVGIKVSVYKSTNRLDNVFVGDGAEPTGTLKNNVTVLFVGPIISEKFLSRNKQYALYLSLGLGYLKYHNDAILIDPYIATGGTFGGAADLGYDIGVSKNLSIGFRLSGVAGVMKEVEYHRNGNAETVKLEKEYYENLTHINVSAGVRYSF